MKIELIEYTGKGQGIRAAAELLVFTKSTRLEMSPGLRKDISFWSDDKLSEELEYMSNTIPSSWEFVDYTFLLTGCTRAFTHQLVRNRHGSYAQQTMRILNVSGFTYESGPTIASYEDTQKIYDDAMENIQSSYKNLIDSGARIEDARGVLPTNIHTNIICKFNLRTLSELLAKRSSPRVQGEYREFVNGLADEILKVHPWSRWFLRNRKVEAAHKLDQLINSLFEIQGKSGTKENTDAIKLIDILRG